MYYFADNNIQDYFADKNIKIILPIIQDNNEIDVCVFPTVVRMLK